MSVKEREGMQTELYSAVKQMKSNGHLSQILKKYDLTLRLTGEEGTWYVLFERDNVILERKPSADDEDVSIEGKDEFLKQLLTGEDFLLAMTRRGDLISEGSLRHLLWLEALFFLCKTGSSKSQ